jgi:uncharacterized protein YlaN (UPF0358 family)
MLDLPNLYVRPFSSNINSIIGSWWGEHAMSSSELLLHLSQKALQLLQEDAKKIETLIQVQMENLATRKCPLYEEVLDTQMYGLSREIDFAVRAGLLEEVEGKELLVKLERNLAHLYEALAINQNQSS